MFAVSGCALLVRGTSDDSLSPAWRTDRLGDDVVLLATMYVAIWVVGYRARHIHSKWKR